MAIVRNYQCSECGYGAHEAIASGAPLPTVCPTCREKKEKKARRQHLAGLKGLTDKERIEKIEAQLYDLNASVRLRALEVNNVRY